MEEIYQLNNENVYEKTPFSFVYKGIAFRHIRRKNYAEIFDCWICKKLFITTDFWRSKNLLYICEDCKNNL